MEKFSYETNGYNRREVNNFVNEVITQTEGIVKKCKEQRNEIEKLKEELKHYRNLESSLKDAIIRAEEAGDNIKRMAREESNMIVTDAKNNSLQLSGMPAHFMLYSGEHGSRSFSITCSIYVLGLTNIP